MMLWAHTVGVGDNWLSLDLSGIHGSCKREVSLHAPVEPEEKRGYDVISGSEFRVVDGHPSESACRKAANFIEGNLHAIALASTRNSTRLGGMGMETKN